MHRVAVAAVLCCVVLAGCGGGGELADDARSRVDGARERLDELSVRAQDVRERFTWCGAAVRLGTAVVERDPEAAAAAAEDLRSTAPAELTDELGTIVTAVGAAQAGDATALLDDEVEAAARTLLDTALDSCGVERG